MKRSFAFLAFVVGAVACHGAATPADDTRPIVAADAGDDDASPAEDAALPNEDASSECAPLSLGGSFDSIVRAIVTAMAGAGSNKLIIPSSTERDAFATTVVGALSGDPRSGCQLPPSYRTFTVKDGADDVLLVAELEASGAPAPVKFWGTYAARKPTAGTRPLVIEAPHPLFDTNTPYEGRAIFTEARADWFLMAGAHRCANTASSPCEGKTTACSSAAASEPYRISDAAHATSLPFFAIHLALSRATTDTFLQIHGNDQACPDALVSDSSGTYSAKSISAKLASAIEARGPSVGRCGVDYPKSGCNLCGTDNVQARATAGASDACTMQGTNYSRFIHLEQKPSLRKIPDATNKGYQPVVDAVVATFPAR